MSFKPLNDRLLQTWYDKLCHAMVEANRAKQRFSERKAYWRDVFEANPFNYREELQRRDALSKDWTLQDANDDYKHWQSEVLRFHAAIHAEMMMRQAMGVTNGVHGAVLGRTGTRESH